MTVDILDEHGDTAPIGTRTRSPAEEDTSRAPEPTDGSGDSDDTAAVPIVPYTRVPR